jgi:gliding motility-associated-like protein
MFRNIFCTVLLTCGVAISCFAQICQGSLGDPIINVTFGSGANPGPPLSAATTNYSYVDSLCPRDGKYSVVNYTTNCFDNTWFTVTDHTGNPNGYFMLVNASYAPGQFYLDTVRGLCGGSTYEFAAWLINVQRPTACGNNPIAPNITFRLEKTDGTLLQTYNTNNILATDPPQWRQYGFFFNTPSGVTEVVIRMVNNAPGGCGNDIGLDDITFRACGPQINVTINGSATTDTVCYGTAKSSNIVAQVSSGFNNPVFQWQQNFNGGNWTDIPGATATNYVANFPASATPGTYQYRLIAAESGNINTPACRVASAPVNIYVAPRPTIVVNNSSPVCAGGTVTLTATANTVTWSGPNMFTASGNNVSVGPVHTGHAGKYYATVHNGSCTWTDSTNVVVRPAPDVIITPDTADLCEGDSVLLTASGAVNYSWFPIQGLSRTNTASTMASPTETTLYNVIGMAADGCADTAFTNVVVRRRPTANAGEDKSILQGASVTLSGSATGDNVRYYWSPDYAMTGSQTLTPSVTPLRDTMYVLHVVSDAGCGSDEDTMRVVIFKNLEVPNAFSPNSDNRNDLWRIPGLSSYPNAEVSVFDRYGREVFRSSRFQHWDGKRNGQPVPAATYYYIINLRNGFDPILGWLYLAR